MALMVANPNQYILGGLSAPRTGIAESFQAGMQANLGRQDARQVMQAREQQMQLAASGEARAQQQFEMQQAAQARAAAEAAQRRAALQNLTAGLRAPGVTAPSAPPAGGTPAIAPVAPPGAGLTMPMGSGVPLSFGTTIPTAGMPPTDSVQVASLDPTESFRQAFAARPDLFGGGVQVADASGGIPAGAVPPATPEGQPTTVDFGGVPFAVYPDGRIVNTLSNTELPATGEYDELRAALVRRAGVSTTGDPRVSEARTFGADVRSAIGGALDRSAGVISAAGTGLYGLASDVSGAAAAVVGADRLAAALERQSDIAYNAALTNLRQGLSATAGLTAEDFDMEPADFRAAVRQAEAAAAAAVQQQATDQTGAEPPSTEAATAEAPTTADEAAPTSRTRWGGLQLNFGTPVQLSFGEFNGRGSEAYVPAPENIFRDAELLDQRQQRLELLATYYALTDNAEGIVGIIGQLKELDTERRFLNGMQAIIGIQQGDFGGVQTILQQRYPGRQVEVRPYTDGTVEIFLDGQSEARIRWSEMATNLRSTYDRGYIEAQQALATEQAERARFAFEKTVEETAQAQREIAVYESRAELDRALAEGGLTQISTEPPIYNMVVNERNVAVTVEPVTVGSGPTATTRFVVRPVDTSAMQ